MTGMIRRSEVELYAAKRRMKLMEDEAAREKRPIPRPIYDKLQAEIRLCRGNLTSAHAAYQGMKRYPPLT